VHVSCLKALDVGTWDLDGHGASDLSTMYIFPYEVGGPEDVGFHLSHAS